MSEDRENVKLRLAINYFINFSWNHSFIFIVTLFFFLHQALFSCNILYMNISEYPLVSSEISPNISRRWMEKSYIAQVLRKVALENLFVMLLFFIKVEGYQCTQKESTLFFSQKFLFTQNFDKIDQHSPKIVIYLF